MMDCVNPAQYKELLCVINFVLGTEVHKSKFLLIMKEIWILEGLSDADFKNDVFFFIIYFMGILVAW